MQKTVSNNNINSIWQQSVPKIAWGTLLLFLIIVVGYTLVIISCLNGHLSYSIGSIACVYFSYACFTVQHDAGHGSIFSHESHLKWIESSLGWVASLPLLVVPFLLFQKIHDRHHAFTNDPNRDPDQFNFGNKWYQIILNIYFIPIKYHWMALFQLRHLKTFRDTYASTFVYLIITIGSLTVLSLKGYGFEVFCFAIIPLIINIFILVMFFDYIPHHPHKSLDRYHNTRIYPSRLLNLLLLGQNYHLIHHMYPRVPWYRYKNVYTKIKPDLLAKKAPIEEFRTSTEPNFMKSPHASMLQFNNQAIHQLLKVKEIRSLTHNTKTISFEIPEGQKFKFQSGQYITVSQWINRSQVTRCYSLCSAPENGGMQIAVTQTPNGLMSNFINKQMKVGDEMIVQGPFGNFIYDFDSKKNVVLIAGGSGITPIFSILKSSLINSNTDKIQLIYACKTQKHILFKHELLQLEKQYQDRLNIHFVLSQEPKSSFGISGRLDHLLLITLIDFKALSQQSNQYYICGPQALQNQMLETLLANKVSSENIHSEQFTVQTNLPKGKQHTVEIKLADGQQQHLKVASNQSILEVAQMNNISIPHACGSGQCGSCKIKIDKGSVYNIGASIPGLTTADQKAGYTLACQCKPKSDLSLRVI